jgi:hypothetical protein
VHTLFIVLEGCSLVSNQARIIPLSDPVIAFTGKDRIHSALPSFSLNLNSIYLEQGECSLRLDFDAIDDQWHLEATEYV